MNASVPSQFIIVVFLAMLAAPPLLQTVAEARRGERPQAMQLFTQRPTPESLRIYDKSLEDSSVTVRTLRPWMQAAQYFVLGEAGEKALVGRDGWLFYQPGVAFLTQRAQSRDSTPHDALAAVLHFRDQLAARGIRLTIMPAPNKESVYPEKLTRFASPPARVISHETRAFLSQCETEGVEVVDLFTLYREDSHWSPAGMERAARAVADRLLTRGWLKPGPVNYDCRPAPVQRLGDIARMSRSPEIEKRMKPDSAACTQVIHRDTAELYDDDPASEVLVLGDSFLRIYQQDDPGSAGFVAHLARALGRPLASIINDGGASTLVRQELFRRPQLLANKKVVVWEFVERDLRLGTEGWQLITIGVPPPGNATPRPTTQRSG
jgi:SGNH hydrolase-like domain, acetyltransferase AlgX